MNHKNKALRLLRDGFQKEFAEYLISHEKFVEVVMEVSAEFIDKEIPIVDQDDKLDLAFLLMETVTP